MGGLRASTFILSSSVCYVENGAQTPPPSSPPPAHTLDPGDRPWTLQDQRTHNCNSGRKTAQRQPETPESHSLGPCWVSKHSWATRNVCISPWLQPCQGWRSGWQRKAGTRFARSRARRAQTPARPWDLGPSRPRSALFSPGKTALLSLQTRTLPAYGNGVFSLTASIGSGVFKGRHFFFFFFSHPQDIYFSPKVAGTLGGGHSFVLVPSGRLPWGRGAGTVGGSPLSELSQPWGARNGVGGDLFPIARRRRPFAVQGARPPDTPHPASRSPCPSLAGQPGDPRAREHRGRAPRTALCTPGPLRPLRPPTNGAAAAQVATRGGSAPRVLRPRGRGARARRGVRGAAPTPRPRRSCGAAGAPAARPARTHPRRPVGA